MFLLSACEDDVKSQLSGCIQSKEVLYSALGTGAGAHLAYRCIPYLGPQEMEQVVQNIQGGLQLADIPPQYISFTEQLIRCVVFGILLNLPYVFKTCTSREFKHKEPVEKLARAILEEGTLCQVCGHPLGERLLLAVMRSYPASALAMLHWAATHLEAVLADVNMVEAVILVVENVLGKYS